MQEITAQLNSYRQSPRKVRLVASSLRGKSVPQAESILKFTVKRATTPLDKLLKSAVANAKNAGISKENLFVKSITVDGGKILYRRMPVAHGAAHPIRKRTSHVKITLVEKVVSPKNTKVTVNNKKEVKNNKPEAKS